ncbi:MAG: transposase [Hyphomonadaceae bacterium]|nr:transposase [Hyphomonadaceae bacterium]
MNDIIDFEVFRPVLDRALKRSDRRKGGRPPFDPVMMFKILILQALNDRSDERAGFLIADRLNYRRFPGLGARLANRNTVWIFHEPLKKAGVMDVLFAAFEHQVTASDYHAARGQPEVSGLSALYRVPYL